MDLLGMSVRDLRTKAKFTVLSREEEQLWTFAEATRLTQCLGIIVFVHQHPNYPHHLIIEGAHSEKTVCEVISRGPLFTHKIVQGFENPELPWVPTA